MLKGPAAATKTHAQLYEDSFTITQTIDTTYDRVSRIMGASTDNTTQLTLDINSQLYPVSTGENVSLLISRTLSLDGKDEDVRTKGWRPRREGEEAANLADLWDYVCYGKVYRHEDPGEGQNM